MGRRRLGLLVALALFLAPAAAFVAQQSKADGHAAASVVATGRHATTVQALRSPAPRERRSPHSPLPFAVFASDSGTTRSVAPAGLPFADSSTRAGARWSASPRAPPTVV
jgi:hypothetical protein